MISRLLLLYIFTRQLWSIAFLLLTMTVQSTVPAAGPPEDKLRRGSSASEDSELSNEEGWEDVEQEDDSQPVVGLFTDQVYGDSRAMLKDAKEKHNFDLQKIQKDLGVCNPSTAVVVSFCWNYS